MAQEKQDVRHCRPDQQAQIRSEDMPIRRGICDNSHYLVVLENILQRAVEMCEKNKLSRYDWGKQADLANAQWIGYWHGQKAAYEHVLEITKDLQLEP